MKILEIQDNHNYTAWIEESRQQTAVICEVAKKEKVDAICVAGDWFDRSMTASDKSKWDEILQLARDLQSVAQVYFVYGTPSHDNPGCYSSLKDIGWKEIGIGKSEICGNTLIMGIPEITPAVLSAKYPEMSKIELIAKQYELVNTLIDTYYAPLAQDHDGPVHFMGHGHISGAKFRDDQKPRTSDFMYSEEMLNRIGATRIQFGHLHLLQKYYGGSAHMTWSDLGFKSGFYVVDNCIEQQRFDYGEPARAKIKVKDIENLTTALESISSGKYENINLWLEIHCDKEFSDQFDKVQTLEDLKKYGIGDKSKVTLEIIHQENSRVDLEEYESCSTTEDIYRMFDDEVRDSVLIKVKEAEDNIETNQDSIVRHNFQFLDLYVKGAIFCLENGVEEFYMSWSDFQTGANLLVGPNGTGKTFSLGLCTPFSEHLPSGLDLKSLFVLKDSQLIRRWSDGDNIITQKILIDPTLASPSAKYFMDINGSKDMFPDVNGNKKPFDDAVRNLFGSIKMFMACAFRGQKENKDYPSLENAKESDLRQIFTELSGVDRSPLKKYAHDKVTILKNSIELDSRETETLISQLENQEELKESVTENNNSVKDYDTETEDKNKTLTGDKKYISEQDTLKTENIGFNKEISRLKSSNLTLNSEVFNLTTELTSLNSTLENSDKYKKELKDLDSLQTQHTQASKKYFDAQGVFNKSVTKWGDDKEIIDNELQDITDKANLVKQEISTKESLIYNSNSITVENQKTIKMLDKPCEHCNKNSSLNQAEIKKLQDAIGQRDTIVINNRGDLSGLNLRVANYTTDYKELRATIPTKPIEPFEVSQLKKAAHELGLKCDDVRLSQLKKIIEGLEESTNKKIEIQNNIILKESSVRDNNGRIEQVTAQLNVVDEDLYNLTVENIFNIERRLKDIPTETGRLNAENVAINDRILKDIERQETIAVIVERVSKTQTDITEWEKIEVDFSPKGIPALELSLIAPAIDREANRLLSIYGGRYRVETITQDFNSTGKKLLEKFKILVHDANSTDIKNLPVISGGQAVWVTKAEQEAISKIASEKCGRTWLYSIMDEADGALDSEIIPVFYDMMNTALDGKRKLVSVTHSTEAKECISSVKNITEFFIGYGE